MPLDLHRKDTNEWIFSLDENLFAKLSPLFKEFKLRTGISFDYYKDFLLSVGHQKILVELINAFQLNDFPIMLLKNKLAESIENKIDIQFYCD